MKEKVVSWDTLARSYICKHPYLSLRRDTRVAPGFGQHDFFVLEFPDWVNIVAVTEEDCVVLVRQFRHGLNAVNLEIPGGVVDPGEDPHGTAIRELAEETGYVAKKMEHLSSVTANPAIQDNWCHIFLATGCCLEGEQELDGTESIEVQLVSWHELSALLEKGEIHHSLNCLAINLAVKKLAAR